MPNGRNPSLEPVVFRKGKPPCAPPYSRHSSSNGAVSGGGKDALMEARIRSLEEAADAATTANVVMKRLYGRALIKRRAAERERDNLRKQLAARDVVPDSSEHLSAPPTPARTTANGPEDDDRRSCASFASSALFGDDRDAQLDSLVDLLELLEAKIAIAPRGPLDSINGPTAIGTTGFSKAATIRGLDSTMIRAKQTIAANRPSCSVPDLIAERDALRSQLDAIKNTPRDGQPPSFDQMAALRAALSDARADATAWRARATALERLRNGAGIGMQVTTAKLQSELAEAKRTIGRLVSERRTLRVASGAASSVQQQSPVPKSAAVPQPDPVRDPRLAPSPDVMRRVLEWRERSLSEVASTAAVHAERTTSTSAAPYTVPISESRKARMAAREISKEASTRRKAVAKERGRNDRPERTKIVTARTEKGMEHLMPERLKSDLSERAANAMNSLNYRNRGLIDRESAVLSERSEQNNNGNSNIHGATSEAESNTSTHRIVGRHLSFGSAAGAPVPSSTPSDFFGAGPTMHSDGLRGLIAD